MKPLTELIRLSTAGVVGLTAIVGASSCGPDTGKSSRTYPNATEDYPVMLSGFPRSVEMMYGHIDYFSMTVVMEQGDGSKGPVHMVIGNAEGWAGGKRSNGRLMREAAAAIQAEINDGDNERIFLFGTGNLNPLQGEVRPDMPARTIERMSLGKVCVSGITYSLYYSH